MMNLGIGKSELTQVILFIVSCMVSTQEDLLRLLRNSGGVKTPNGGVNKKMSGGVYLQGENHQNSFAFFKFSLCALISIFRSLSPLFLSSSRLVRSRSRIRVMGRVTMS